MSLSVRDAQLSLLFAGVVPSSVRTMRPAGCTHVVALCVRNGLPLYAHGVDVADALTNLATVASYAAIGQRGMRGVAA